MENDTKREDIKKKLGYSIDSKLVNFIEGFSSYNMVPVGLVLKMVIGGNDKLIKNLEANTDKLQENIQRNSILVTALVPQLGYDKAAEIAKEAMSSNKTIKEVLLDSNLFSSDEIDNLLDIEKLI